MNFFDAFITFSPLSRNSCSGSLPFDPEVMTMDNNALSTSCADC